MHEIICRDGTVTLTVDGTPVFVHSKEEPFLCVSENKNTYSSFHGNLKEKVVDEKLLPLPDAAVEGDTIRFSGNGFSVTVAAAEKNGGTVLALQPSDREVAIRFCLYRNGDEAVFGGGERYRRLCLSDREKKGDPVIPNLVTEHIILKTIVQKTLLPYCLYREKDNSFIGSYVPMPVFVTAGRLLLMFRTPAGGRTEFAPGAIISTFHTCPEELFAAQCGSFREISRLQNRLYPSRQYLPERYRRGMILGVQGGDSRVMEKAFALQDAGAGISAVWCQDWCGENITPMGKQVRWNYEKDDLLYPHLEETIQKLEERGIAFLGYVNPYVLKGSPMYRYCAEKGYLITHRDGSIYHMKSTTFDAGMLDLTNPEAVAYIKETILKKNMLALGMKGWMADFGEYLPMDCVLHDGDPAELHNVWPVLWARLNREVTDEWGDPDVFFFSRSGYLGTSRYVPILWNGDQHTDFTRDYGMPSVIPASLSMGLSGIPLCHSDIGGFFSFTKIRRNRERLIRWMELCCLSPLMRSHESLRPGKSAQPYDPAVLPYTARLTGLHTQLEPYLSAVIRETEEGIPALRPDFYETGEYRTGRDEYAYFLGPDLYVCPVVRGGARARRVLLPEGSWKRLLTDETYDGGKPYTVKCPLGTPAAFYRADSEYAAVFASAGRMWNK